MTTILTYQQQTKKTRIHCTSHKTNLSVKTRERGRHIVYPRQYILSPSYYSQTMKTQQY